MGRYLCWWSITINSKKNVDIQFDAHDAFLEKSLKGSLIINRLENQIMYKSEQKQNTKWPKQDLW
jgi:hypothetical protein